MKKFNSRLYEPPRAKDLSAPGVHGDVGPLGWCVDGTEPSTVACEWGFATEQPDACSPTGISPTLGKCSVGIDGTVSWCTSGSLVQ